MEKVNPIILYDGICNLCNTVVRLIEKRDKDKQFCFKSLQSEEAEELVMKFNLSKEIDSVIFLVGNKAFTESDAIIEISGFMHKSWNWMAVMKILPKAARDKIYRWITKNRYKWFGIQHSCKIFQG